jgi:hypothetical protein
MREGTFAVEPSGEDGLGIGAKHGYGDGVHLSHFRK